MYCIYSVFSALQRKISFVVQLLPDVPGKAERLFCFSAYLMHLFKGRERNAVKPSTFYIEEAGYVE
ncbi:MAG: hypothetical protein D3914_10350 [Candidatus Electrothrix sp. LOE2]|nr:hypothetical protein [Candidatus Electrothrix sp. LOE2]